MVRREGRVRARDMPRAGGIRPEGRVGVGSPAQAAVQQEHRALQVRRAVRPRVPRRLTRRRRAQGASPQRRAARRPRVVPRRAAQAPHKG